MERTHSNRVKVLKAWNNWVTGMKGLRAVRDKNKVPDNTNKKI